jgi:hypothetical protein
MGHQEPREVAPMTEVRTTKLYRFAVLSRIPVEYACP